MRDAEAGVSEAEFYETMLEYCQAILNAETEEEVQEIKEQVVEMLVNEYGYDEDDPSIDVYMTRLDHGIDMIESGEATYDEILTEIHERFEPEAIQEVDAIPVQTNNVAITAGLGLGLGVFIGCIAMRKKTLKNKKNKSL